MNVSYRWLRSIAPTIEADPAAIAERLGMLGAPVDELNFRGEGLDDILVARVEAVRPHPNADRLRICAVDAGGGPLQVVCGAPNVVAGGTYPFAPVGATLPGGMVIRRAKIRGEPSEGMLCSPSELGLGRDHSGLMTLAGAWDPGSRLLDGVDLQDAVLVLDITPNRADLLSHLGVARELAPGGYADVRFEPFSRGGVSIEYVEGRDRVASGEVTISIEDGEDCPRYVGAVLEGVRVSASPEWLASQLRAVGLRPINNVVDATNFVLHELGQPLHAFDLDLLAGSEIRVRRARQGEQLRTLDGVNRTLEPSMLVIADRDRPVALAGVMGGEDTEVSERTGRILIECAMFDSRRVRAGAKSAGLLTDASHRYERGVDPLGQRRAVERVIDLILATAGGTIIQPVVDVHPRPHEQQVLTLRRSRVRQVLGVDFSGEEIEALLEPIGFEVRSADDAIHVEVPSFRPDITREIDLIEEVARRRGYDYFDAPLRGFRPGAVPPDPLEQSRRAVHAVLMRWGFFEARTAAFAPANDARVPLLNPLSADESHLRDDLVSGLLRRVEHNWSHGVRAVRLFEVGSVFGPADGLPREEVRLAAVITGARRPPLWDERSEAYDVWDLKGLLEEIADMLQAAVRHSEAPLASVVLDRSESFALVGADGVAIGGGGRVRRSALDTPAWADPVWALEIRLVPTRADPHPVYRDLPSFPAVERDIALVVPPSVNATMIEGTILTRAGDILESLRPFDVYEGEALGQGHRSIAWRLRYRHPERTLTDREVDDDLAGVVTALQEEHGVRRR